MSSVMNTVAKEAITPTKVMNLPLVDTDISSIVIPVRSESEARMILMNVRGF